MVLQRGLEPRVNGHKRPFSLRGIIKFCFAKFGVRGRALFHTNSKRPAFRRVVLGAPAGARTPDTRLKRAVLYLLSYWGLSSSSNRSGFDLKRKKETVDMQFSAVRETEWSSFLLTWLGWRDSNPLYRSQSPVCYHYTTSHYGNTGLNKGRLNQPYRKGWDMGLEPTTPGTTIRCSTN